MHKFNNLKSSYHFLKNFLARCARSIALYRPLRNESMQYALATLFIFFRLLSGHYPLTGSFQNSMKTRINCTKVRIQCPKIVCGGTEKRGKDVRMEGRAPWLLGGSIDDPGSCLPCERTIDSSAPSGG